jgi:hypothetical protein
LSKQTNKQGIGKLKNWKIRMTGNNKHLSILTLNVNGFNAPVKDIE